MSEENPKIIRRAEPKKAMGTYRTARMVLQAWDDQEHAVKREQLDRKAEVQIKARERL